MILLLYDRNITIYKISNQNNLGIVTDTLNGAVSKQKGVRGLIIHSDKGFQYTSFQYKKTCESNVITISMSRKRTRICKEN